MANEINWVNHLSSTEIETYAELVNNGIKVYAAPIIIESSDQLNTLGITRADCFMQWIGPRKVLVHLSPVSKDVYDVLYSGSRAEYRREARSGRCMITGKNGHPIHCPECNKCAQCPFPEIQERHLPNNLSWDALINNECEPAFEEFDKHHMEVMDDFESVTKIINARKPKYLKAIVPSKVLNKYCTKVIR